MRAPRLWGFTHAFSCCVGVRSPQLLLRRCACPSAVGAFSCCVSVRAPQRWGFTPAFSCCVPLGGVVLHQLSRCACASAVGFYTCFVGVRAPRRWGCVGVRAPSAVGFIPAFSCCVGVRAPRLLLLRRCAYPSAVGFYTSFLLLHRCACPLAVGFYTSFLLLRGCACPSEVGFYSSFLLLRRSACPSARIFAAASTLRSCAIRCSVGLAVSCCYCDVLTFLVSCSCLGLCLVCRGSCGFVHCLSLARSLPAPIDTACCLWGQRRGRVACGDSGIDAWRDGDGS